MKRVLIAEDEERIASFIEKGLRGAGFRAEVVPDGLDAFEHARSGQYDLLILDIGLPRLDGFSVLRRLRSERVAIPVIILTARDGVEDTVAGLTGGADDYMPKPFAFDELLARVKLRLQATGTYEAAILQVGSIRLDTRTRRVEAGEDTIELTAREFSLLELLMQHPGEVLTRQQLLSRVWGLDFDPGTNIVDVYVGYLRGKLGSDLIETVRGVGYRLVTGADPGDPNM